MTTRNHSEYQQKRSSKDIASEALVKELHLKLFPEEYDAVYDSVAEAHDRKSGINPMHDTYLDAVKVKREQMGLSNSANAYETLEWVRKKLSDGYRTELDGWVLNSHKTKASK